MDALWIVILLAAAVVAALVSLRPTRSTIFEYERGLKFTRGRFKGVLPPGEYWHSRAATQIHKVDVRPSRTAVAGQEVLTADGVAVKASLAATFHVADPERAILGAENYHVAIHTELQLALRAVATSLTIDQLLQQRADLPARLLEIAAPRLLSIGVALDAASLRDLTFPGELKKIFAQVVKARQEGLAALEKARGETAALRNLANAAQLIERNPSLMQLRALQALAQQPGNTLVLGLTGGSPIPLRTPKEVTTTTEPGLTPPHPDESN